MQQLLERQRSCGAFATKPVNRRVDRLFVKIRAVLQEQPSIVQIINQLQTIMEKMPRII